MSTEDALRSFIERIEFMEDEKKRISEDIGNIYSEAKGAGFDPAIMKKIVRLRRMDPEERKEQESILETYLSALGMK